MANNEVKNNRIKEALGLRNMRQADLSEKTGIKKASINSWVKQRYQPKQNSLLLMARALDVSELWLAGYDVPMERPVEQKKMDELATLVHQLRKNEELKSLCLSISTLNDSQFRLIYGMVNELLSNK